MPKKSEENNQKIEIVEQIEHDINEHLEEMLAAVLNYISDDEVEVIDIAYLLDNTKGLREWWDEYKEKNRKHIEEEIKNSLSDLSLEDLEKIREQIKANK